MSFWWIKFYYDVIMHTKTSLERFCKRSNFCHGFKGGPAFSVDMPLVNTQTIDTVSGNEDSNGFLVCATRNRIVGLQEGT